MDVYNRDQWVQSFEGQLAILRPHLTQRLLTTMSLAAWHEHGTAGIDPIKVAKELSAVMDRQQGKAPAPSPRRRS
jgi:hypothetical protein